MTHPTVDVTGHARIDVQPDAFVVSTALECGGDTPPRARNSEHDRRQTLVSALDETVRSDQITVTATYIGQTETKFHATSDAASIARSTLEIRCDAASLDAVVMTATNTGATIETIEPRVDEAKRDDCRRDLLEAATQNARTQAETIAVATDNDLGQLVSLSTSPDRPFESIVDEALATDLSANYTPGPIEFTATVTATYELSSS